MPPQGNATVQVYLAVLPGIFGNILTETPAVLEPKGASCSSAIVRGWTVSVQCIGFLLISGGLAL